MDSGHLDGIFSRYISKWKYRKILNGMVPKNVIFQPCISSNHYTIEVNISK